MFAITAGGYIVFDYRMAARWAGAEGTAGLTFGDYLSGLPGRLANLGGGAIRTSGLPSSLEEMLPKPPAGWTVRPAEPADTEAFLPKDAARADKAGAAAVAAMAAAETESGVEVAALTYEKGDRKLIIRATRYPNMIFTSTAAIEQRTELRTKTAEFRGTEFATVRGLDLTEDLLPDGFRGRMFLADVGAQIHLRVLAPKRMKDEELVPFLETLHVKAMNADVIDKIEGLGDVPVIVVASALGDAERDSYLADVAARKAEEARRYEADLQAVRAEEKAEAAKVQNSTSIFDGLKGALFGEDKAEMSADERKQHETALIDAAKSGDAAAAAAHAEALYGAIADELGKTEMKAAPSSSGSGPLTSGAGSSGKASSIGLGTGTCTIEAGRKLCSVGGGVAGD